MNALHLNEIKMMMMIIKPLFILMIDLFFVLYN